MPNTFTLIASSTVGSGGAANINFTSIPSTYTDLCIKTSLRSTGTSGTFEYLLMRFNGSSASNYTAIGSGTSRASQPELWASVFAYGANNANDTANSFSNGNVYIPNYLSSNTKSVSVDSIAESNQTGLSLGITAGVWTLTSAITSILLFPLSGSWAQHSTAYLYGIKKD
jgi:hypothetical protein